ncbi:Chloramphenicol acetyltransferase-like domain protein [Metarhizium guizhouense ARSEF 977]|uniref:Chloramphenicol acetyltransferase-like domain protein n=1 Tax=Metarhizium guizhouense (strain ARSEF 977) TaxID=1276136 RepID=A0A0B4G5S5_METGA|nr:Chloramphenicol acetyltransferase-like domain protein [Metarhizium guizhouense ARSEF 977]
MDNYRDMERYRDNALGQLCMLQAYSHLMYFFPMPENTTKDQIIRDLTAAVTKIRQAVPWVGCRVINTGRAEGCSGTYFPVACDLPSPAVDARDLTDDASVSPYHDFQQRRAPVSMINTGRLTSVPGFPVQVNVDADAEPAHVLRVQANFIRGGVLVDFAMQHNMADARGHFGVIRMVAAAMRGESFPTRLLDEACRDRRTALPLLGEFETMLDHSHHKRPPVTPNTPLAPPAAARYHAFRFSRASMEALRQVAGSGSSNGARCQVPEPVAISVDDAICALSWQRLTMARRCQLSDAAPSRFGRQADGRRLIGLSPDYMADVVHTVSAWLTVEQLATMPLSSVAAHLRARLDETNTAYNLRSFATFVAREPDKSTITYAGTFDPAIDVGCTSTRGMWREAFPNFGLLGVPQFIRRPPSILFPSTLGLFPGTATGDCDAVACLTDRDFQALMADAEWLKFAEYLG